MIMQKRGYRALVRVAALPLMIVGLEGCITVGPDFHHPTMKEQPGQWKKAADAPAHQKSGQTYGGQVDVAWWHQFHDDELDRLVTRLGAQNLNVQEAATRIGQSRGQLKVAASEGMPTLNWAGSYTWTQQSKRGFLTIAQAAPGSNLQYQQYTNIGAASWDMDLFGRIRRSVEAGQSEVLQAVAAQRGVALASLADLVGDYLSLRGVQEQIRLTERHLELVHHDLSLVLDRQREGAANALEVAQARGQVEETESALPPLKDAQAALINAIGYILALPPRALEEELLPRRAQPVPPASIGIGVPSALVERRPDIMEADARLHAAVAEVGAAKAAFYPDITLTGNLGTQSLSASDFFMPAAKYFTLGPTLNVPIFEGGRLSGGLKLRKAQQKEAAIAYHQVMLNAWREVDDAITKFAQVNDRYHHLEETVKQNRLALKAAREQYTTGAVPFLEVDQAEAALLANDILLASSRTETASAMVSLYRALGGGWQIINTSINPL
ncbi:RND efflux system outer membrane lipoprotein [Saccharibacter floricola DSM 15669]|uniref:RND efflux system outer membrane lipoprotein n=2 Tax=Saccharibacter TaxID=231052 RepID=A0ABQ0P0Q1_9PROT|nr:efflux transporter outer membrane subunit [Saccharibacter floricola]GBQ08238.1 RND efflux system outer membrane lipoprotein [Saccharibacter floricola DSM 15669]